MNLVPQAATTRRIRSRLMVHYFFSSDQLFRFGQDLFRSILFPSHWSSRNSIRALRGIGSDAGALRFGR